MLTDIPPPSLIVVDVVDVVVVIVVVVIVVLLSVVVSVPLTITRYHKTLYSLKIHIRVVVLVVVVY